MDSAGRQGAAADSKEQSRAAVDSEVKDKSKKNYKNGIG